MANSINLETEKPSNKFGKFLTIGALAIAAVAGSAFYLTNANSGTDGFPKESTSKESVSNSNVSPEVTVNTYNKSSSIENKEQKTLEVIKKETSFPIFEASSLVNEKNKERLNKVGDFELPSGLADNQVARNVAQLQFSREDYFLALVSEGEGFRSTIYNDNIGYAFGNGWNVSMQSKSYNENLAKAVSQDSEFARKLGVLGGRISDTTISSDYKNVRIAPQRAIQVAALMGEQFEPGVIRGIAKQMPKNSQAQKLHKETGQSYEVLAKDMYDNLAPNEKAAILYHSYKVGEAGFAKYTNMIGSLVSYGLSTNKTDVMRKSVADGFTYKYKMNGEIKEDTRASVLVGSMFSDSSAFGYVVGKNVAPKNFSKLTTSISKNGIASDATPGLVFIPDPVGLERARLEAIGGKIDIQLMPAVSVEENMKNMRGAPPSSTPSKRIPYSFSG